MDVWVAPAVPFDPDLLDALLPALACTALAAAAGVGWVHNRRLLRDGATRPFARRGVAWAAATAAVNGVAVVAFSAAFLINVLVA